MNATLIDTNLLIRDFLDITKIVAIDVSEKIIKAEVLHNPHLPPSSLPKGTMAVYVFIWGKRCLKVGKVGPNSNARYTSQHYNPWSSKSNLAASILKHKDELGLPELTDEVIGSWIKKETTRINFLVSSEIGMPVLSLLESFLQCRLRPEFEGFESQRS